MNKKEISTAILTLIALLCLTVVVNKVCAQDYSVKLENDKSIAYFGMGYSNMFGMGGVAIDMGAVKHTGAGWYFGAETANSGGGANDAFGLYGGITASFSKKYLLRQGITFGGTSSGNTVTNLSAYGVGNLVGTDGDDSGYIGYDTGFQFPLTKFLSMSVAASITTGGTIFRSSLNITI